MTFRLVTVVSIESSHFNWKLALRNEALVLSQLFTMLSDPLANEPASLGAHFAFNNRTVDDGEASFELAVPSVKVWRRMIVYEHAYLDSVKLTDRRHQILK
jgi:hypothetical protein